MTHENAVIGREGHLISLIHNTPLVFRLGYVSLKS